MPKVYLIPNFLHQDAPQTVPDYIAKIVSGVRCFAVEEGKSARMLLKEISPTMPLAECLFFELSEHTSPEDIKTFFAGHKTEDIGIIPEAGVPCVADPGAELVRLAHEHHVEVVPLVGPSSVILALMASGLNGQNFAFNGYLPKEKDARVKKLRELERRSAFENQTQIFMETPYRNQNIFDEILEICDPKTLLCVAVDITAPSEFIKTMPVDAWKVTKISLNKRPALFLILKNKK